MRQLNGNSPDIAGLMLMLDIGDISDMQSGMCGRRELLYTLYGEFDGVPEGIWKTSCAALEKLKRAKESCEPVRMWVCNGNPAELCGMYFVCWFLKDAPTQLFAVRVPEQIAKTVTR